MVQSAMTYDWDGRRTRIKRLAILGIATLIPLLIALFMAGAT